jgi:hypothetical protein
MHFSYRTTSRKFETFGKFIKIIALCFSVFGLVSSFAQSDDQNRCEVKRTADIEQFEHWLSSKRVEAFTMLNTTYKIPVVIHIIHTGEPVGEGFNYSAERIESQIRTLNEDFRRKDGTPGFNSHPDGEDSQIEFVLAQIDPEGNPTDGFVRIDRNLVDPPSGVSDFITLCSKYSYWDPEQYLNIWCMDIGLHGIYTGKSSFPTSTLDGLPAEDDDALSDGIFINAINFGQGENTVANLDMGRTLTHEMGHFLGLLHTFGQAGNCDYSDYCEDTPPISSATYGCPAQKPVACDSRSAMIENYMDYSSDRCMNIFTKDQVARMHIVLENSPRRKSLLTSPVISRDERGIPYTIQLYPNPATDRLYLSVDEKLWGCDVNVRAYTLLGKIVFNKTFIAKAGLEIPVSNALEDVLLLTIEGPGLSHKQLVMIK